MSEIKRKYMLERAPSGDPLEYVMSDSSIDRYGDIVEQDGWQLSNFRKNPIALFGHNSGFPIGKWKNVRVEAGKLLGHLELLAKGTSARIDEVIAAVEAGVLRAVSVGFAPLEMEPIDEKDLWGGYRFTKSELVECSLVAVPANPNALAVARSLHLSDETQSLIFGEPARELMRTRAVRGEPADPPRSSTPKKDGPPMRLAEKIQAAEKRLTELRDQLSDHITKTAAGDDMDDAAIAATEELNDRIASAQKTVDALKKAEASLGEQATFTVPGAGNAVAPAPSTIVAPGGGAAPRDKMFATVDPISIKRPGDLMIRALVSRVQGRIQQRDPADVMAERYGDHRETREVLNVVCRAATAPATTTTSGWASQLVNTVYLDFVDTLMPMSVYPGLSARGGRFTFGRAGVVSIPSRASTPTIAGSFVGEGAPIPVRQGAVASITLTPKKMAVISTFTREIAEHSTPSIEALIREMIQDDTTVALDTVLLDATAASAIRPAGLRNGVTVTTATAGGGTAAFIGDLKALVGVLVAANSLRAPVWIMNPVNVLSAKLLQNAGGDLMFAGELEQGMLLGYPILQSTTMTAGMVLLVDAADFFSAAGDVPRFDVNDSATLHLEDTTPLAIGTAGAPATVAAPVRSLWQTDSIGIRMLLDVNWAMRRTGVIAWTQSVTW